MAKDLTITLNDTGLKQMIAQTKAKVNSSDLLLMGGVAVCDVIKRHIAELAISRHKTATALLAIPTQHYKTQLVSEPQIRGKQAVVGISIRGINRAYGDLHIKPIRARALTIPIHALAYGVSVKELKARGKVLFRPKGTDILAMVAPQAEKGFIPMYALKKSITIPQDRTLMPLDSELKNAFKKAIQATLKQLAKK